jgi:hypothetical protein
MPPYNAPSWKELVRSLEPKVRCGPPATEAQIAAVEQTLGVRFPQQLRDVLSEANGVIDRYSQGPVWPLTRIEEQNREFRSYPGFRELYMPFDNLLLFGAEVNSDHFAFAIQADGQVHNTDIFIWDHETDGRSWYAGHLEQFLEKQLKREGDDDEDEDDPES